MKTKKRRVMSWWRENMEVMKEDMSEMKEGRGIRDPGAARAGKREGRYTWRGY